MNWTGNLRKMRTESGSVVKYFWSGRDVLDDMPELFANDWIGEIIRIKYEGKVHCVVTGKEWIEHLEWECQRTRFSIHLFHAHR